MKLPIKIDIHTILQQLSDKQKNSLLIKLLFGWPHNAEKCDYFRYSEPISDPETGEQIVIKTSNPDPDAKCTCGGDEQLVKHIEFVMELDI